MGLAYGTFWFDRSSVPLGQKSKVSVTLDDGLHKKDSHSLEKHSLRPQRDNFRQAKHSRRFQDIERQQSILRVH